MLTTSLFASIVFFVAALVSTLAGLAIRSNMAERVRLDQARDMIGGVTGLVVTLVALVLGLLIWTAFGVFSTQKAELQGIAASALEFNQETREYGPDAAHARALMRTDLSYAHRQLWGDAQTSAAAIAASVINMDNLSAVLDHLEPKTDAQKALLADARHNYEVHLAITHSYGAARHRRRVLARALYRVCVDLHRLLPHRAEFAFEPRNLRRGGARLILRGQRPVLGSRVVATLHQ